MGGESFNDHGSPSGAPGSRRAESPSRSRLPAAEANPPRAGAGRAARVAEAPNSARLLVCELVAPTDWSRHVVASLRAHDRQFSIDTEVVEESRLDRLPDMIRSVLPNVVILAFPAPAWALAAAAVPVLQQSEAHPAIIAVTDLTSQEQLDRLLDLGVADYLTPPLRDADIVCRTRRWAGLWPEERTAADELKHLLGLQGFVGQSPALLAELNKLPRFARADACVLILGETGTGKELCARAVHHLSLRAACPFLAVNTGAIPTELIENELFGHEAGAYTSARGPVRGLIAAAQGGTLFLDEIDTLPLAAQVKLLRFLQEKEYRPLGARRNIQADVRVIAASNTNLAQAVAEGRFRKDLFYRVNVLPLTLPSLGARKEDIPLLAQHFMAKHGTPTGRSKLGIGLDALAKLQRYDWPGNVRELESVIERAVVLSEDWLIGARDIDLPVPDPPAETAAPETFRAAKARVVRDFESAYLREKLERHGGNISQAARASGKNRRAFFALMKKHRIRVRVAPVPEAQNQIQLTVGGEEQELT